MLSEWVISFIVPIHKGGAKSDPSNYRGVSLLSCLGKLFLSILNNRLEKFALDNGILSASQLGFVKGNWTSDAHIIIHNLIDKYCHKNNKKNLFLFYRSKQSLRHSPERYSAHKTPRSGYQGKSIQYNKGDLHK